jgi:hypothetical protein
MNKIIKEILKKSEVQTQSPLLYYFSLFFPPFLLQARPLSPLGPRWGKLIN